LRGALLSGEVKISKEMMATAYTKARVEGEVVRVGKGRNKGGGPFRGRSIAIKNCPALKRGKENQGSGGTKRKKTKKELASKPLERGRV